jgi:hypothetical protein
VQHEFQPVLLQQLRDGFGREVVGEQELHRLESRFRGSFKTVEERQLVPEHGEVGGEAGHDVLRSVQQTLSGIAMRRIWQ